MRRPTGRGLVRAVLIAVTGMILLAALVFPLVAARTIESDVLAGPNEVTNVEPPQPSPGADAVLRELPLVPPGGFIEARFPDRQGFTDAVRVRQAIFELSAAAGVPDLPHAALDDVTDFGYNPYDEQTYPYRYPDVDPLVASAISGGAFVAEPRLAVELASLLVVYAYLTDSPSTPAPATLAYSVLHQLAASVNDCDIQTSLVYIVANGFRPNPANLGPEVARAVELCPRNDLTPRWIEAQLLAERAGFDYWTPGDPLTGVETRQAALDAFQGLQDEFPQHPAGYAGEADLLLQWAVSLERGSAQPFQVRRWRQRALDLYRRARSISSDSSLALGHAMALAANGRTDEALQELDARQGPAAENQYFANLVRTEIQVIGHRHAEAADTIATEDNRSQPWWISASIGVHDAKQQPYSFAASHLPTVDYLMEATYNPFGGGSADDSPFIPGDRYLGPSLACRAAIRVTELVLAGRSGEVAPLLRSGQLAVEDLSGENPTCDEVPADAVTVPIGIAAVAALEVGDNRQFESLVALELEQDIDEEPEIVARFFEGWQNLLRHNGERVRAHQATQQWVDRQREEPTPWQRKGEVEFLSGEFGAAADSFRRAGQLLARSHLDAGDDLGYEFEMGKAGRAAWIQLQLGSALDRLGQTGPATEALRQASALTADPDQRDTWYEYIAAHAHSQLGTAHLRRQEWAEASRELETALRVADNPNVLGGAAGESEVRGTFDPAVGGYDLGILHGAAQSNLSLAYAKLDRCGESVPVAEAAVARDPSSPIFRDTLGFALQCLGKGSEAVEQYRLALEADPGSYPSANNMAVLLARSGDRDGAIQILRSILAAKPDYAVGWFNLGLLHSSGWAGRDVVYSEAAFAHAIRLDRELAVRDRELVPDLTIYSTGLDTARPLSPDWSFLSSATVPRTPNWVWAVVGLIAVRVVTAVLADRLGGAASGLIVSSNLLHNLLAARGPLVLAVLVGCVAAAGLSFWERPTAATMLVVGVTAALVTLVVVVRGWALGRAARQFSWGPSVVAGFFGAAVGLPFAPYPCVDPDIARTRAWPARLVGPLIITAFGAAGLVVTVATGSPLMRSLALASLALLASNLVPIRPLDGCLVASRRANVIITVGLVAATVVFAVPLV